MNSIEKIQTIVGKKIVNKQIIQQAFIHSSYANETKKESNERLEFLGDAVLELVITDYLYRSFNLAEGKLTKYRASLVSESTLAFVVEELGLDKYLLRGKGESKSKITSAEKCDLYEAVVGALYIDGGIELAKKFILSTHETVLQKLKTDGLEENAKNQLQEMLANKKICYKTTKHGQDHSPIYKSLVTIDGVGLGSGEGTNKKSAEQMAAKNTIKMIKKA